MSDLLLQEIDEELRRDRMKALWKRYGGIISACAVVLVLLIAGWRGYVAWQQVQAAKDGDALFAAILLSDKGPTPESDAQLEKLIEKGAGGTALLARFRLAGDQARAGNPDKAIAAFDGMANDSSIPTTLRDLARVRAGLLLLDRASPAEVDQRVEQLTNESNSYRHAARELMGLAAYKAKNFAAAARWFEALIADAECPLDARGRGQVFLTLLAADGMTPEQAHNGESKE